MACGACERRRHIVRAALKRRGAAGVVKIAKQLGRDVLKNPPRFITRNGKPVRNG